MLARISFHFIHRYDEEPSDTQNPLPDRFWGNQPSSFSITDTGKQAELNCNELQPEQSVFSIKQPIIFPRHHVQLF